MLESIFTSSIRRGGMLKSTKELDFYKELVVNVVHHQEKGISAKEFAKEYEYKTQGKDISEIPKPKIVKGMPPAFKKRLEEEYQ